MVFIMLVGLPASGKTTLASLYRESCGYTSFSSDDIRIELFGRENGFTKEQNAQVFDEMLKRTKTAMDDGQNVIYDATNIRRKRRINTLTQLKAAHPDAEYRCILCIVPYGVCKSRNNARWFDQVPEDVVERMYKTFEVPCQQEGWNSITCFYSANKDMSISDYIMRGIGYDQQNPYHQESLSTHMMIANRYIKEHYPKASENVRYATLLHDIGKLSTKTVTDGVAHYYQHENVGSYNVLLLKDELPDKLYISLLVSLHMRPMLYADNPDLETKDRALYGDSVIDDLLMIYDADIHSRKEKDVE